MTENRARLKPSAVPGQASAEGDLVVLDGPDGVAVTMTADAADLTADSLHQAASEARKFGPTASDTGAAEDLAPPG